MDGCMFSPLFLEIKKWGNIIMTQQFSHQLPPKVSENIPTLKTEEKKKQNFKLIPDFKLFIKMHHKKWPGFPRTTNTPSDLLFLMPPKTNFTRFFSIKNRTTQNKSPSVPLEVLQCHHSIERLPPSRWGRSFYRLVTVGVPEVLVVDFPWGIFQHNLMTWWEFLSDKHQTPPFKEE